MKNIILSRYPIISTIFSEIDDDTDFNDIIGTHTVMAANISISGNIVSVYNMSLSKDIRTVHINNSDIRHTELNAIFSIVDENQKNLNSKELVTYRKTNIHLLVGSLNINEMDGQELDPEFTNIISKRHLVDIFRCLTNNDFGYTNTLYERLNYIFMILTDDVYDQKSKLYAKLQKLETQNDLLNFIFDRYGVYFLDSYIYNDINIQGRSNNFPVECVFMLDKKKH